MIELTTLRPRLAPSAYDNAERQFATLLRVEELDRRLENYAPIVDRFEEILAEAIRCAYAPAQEAHGPQHKPDEARAHLFLQRTLYCIYRMKLFWYDDLRSYSNERSIYLQTVRDRIEEPWQEWELAQLDLKALRGADVPAELGDRVEADLAPADSNAALYFRDTAGRAAYCKLLAIASLDGLVEASQLSRMLGGPGNPVHAVLTRLLVEEYGFGRLNRKHSSFFAAMLSSLGMRTEPEAYFDQVPWEVLATINHSFLLSERKRWFLRYIGGLLQTEISVPAAFAPYRAAAERLGLSEEAKGYWDLHIKVDQAHGRWMLNDVAMPLLGQYGADGWELLLGYDQQRLMSARAGAAIYRAARKAEEREEGKRER